MDIKGGTYHVNGGSNCGSGGARVQFEQNGGDDIRVIRETLTEPPVLRGYSDNGALTELSSRFQVGRSGPVRSSSRPGSR
ncbi:hypothetical protein SAMN04487983_10537 [Streptomyces sp. yr375]|nr:hypothetical protein SAMN04487983_10537 [Streptomyces sp. yr375]